MSPTCVLSDSQARARIWLVCSRVFLGAAVIGICALARGQMPAECELPKSLAEKVKQVLPGYSVITANALRKSDRSRYRADHGASCPGLVKIDFYGTRLPTYGIAVAKLEDKKMDAKLLVATQTEKVTGKWSVIEVDSAATLTSAPVIWAEPPGEYRDVHRQKTINAKHPVLLFVGYESWAIVYAWNGTEIQKVWVSD